MTAKELADQPSFPFQGLDRQGFPIHEQIPGMTLRQYYAGLAMQGILAGQTIYTHDDGADQAQDAVKFTDALIAELAKP